MTRLVPTRDRAQATRFTLNCAEEICRALNADRFKTTIWSDYDAKRWAHRGWINPLPEYAASQKEYIWFVEVAHPAMGDFWSGPWYVREVAE